MEVAGLLAAGQVVYGVQAAPHRRDGDSMRAYHFLRTDMTAGYGTEEPWREGETREIPKGDRSRIELCEYGYHSSPSWYDALGYAPGAMGCIVAISKPTKNDGTKQVSHTRTLVAARDMTSTLRLWGVECARRALERERSRGRAWDPRSWTALEVAGRHARGEASDSELAAASAARAAASAAWA